MALHDVAKSIKRNTPKPNAHDLPDTARMAHGTNASNVVTDASPAFAAGLLNGDWRLALSGTATMDATSTTAGTPVTITIPHGLSYIPLVSAVRTTQDSGVYQPLPNAFAVSNSGIYSEFTGYFWATVDGTNLYINLMPAQSGNYSTQFFRYYLFQQTAN